MNANPNLGQDAALGAALTALGAGAPVVVLTAQPLLLAAARGIDAATVNLMAREGRGLICHAMSAAQMLDLGLRLIPSNGVLPGAWRFAVSYEAGQGCGTGISAADRARTLNAGAAGLGIVTPGHVIPVLGDADAPGIPAHPPSLALRLMQMAALPGGAAICTILDAEGAVASPGMAAALAARLGLRAVAADLLTRPVAPAL